MKQMQLGVLLFSFTWISYSQDTIAISKKEILEKSAAANLQLKIAANNWQASKAEYQQSNATFLPNLTVSHTGISTTNPLMAFGSKLNQEILTASDFNPTLLNDPKKTQNFATKIEIQQPLVNMDGIYGRLAAKAKMEAMQLQSERTKEYIALEVSKAYMQLQLAYKAVKVVSKANQTAKANLKMVENYYKNGILPKTDLLNVQVRVNEVINQLAYAQSNVQNASDYISLLCNEEASGKTWKPSEELENAILETSVNTSIPDTRKDFQALQKSSEAYEKMWQSSRFGFLPRLNAFGSYELYDSTLFGTSAKGYLVGAQIAWNVFDGYKTIGKMQKAKTDLEKSNFELEQYKKQSQLEFHKTNRQLKDAENKIHLAKLAYEQSQEAYRIRQNRFAQGLEKTSDLLLSEAQMAQKELEHLQAILEYNVTKEYLQFLTQ